LSYGAIPVIGAAKIEKKSFRAKSITGCIAYFLKQAEKQTPQIRRVMVRGRDYACI